MRQRREEENEMKEEKRSRGEQWTTMAAGCGREVELEELTRQGGGTAGGRNVSEEKRWWLSWRRREIERKGERIGCADLVGVGFEKY